ncbi:MAG TPA: ABC transporter ATP-binding protein [Chloroflexota bacterium]|jgi:NitT/TauT family transport system ATP-binding protein|nr:ABC transporter ATP-binding protein [Chloroflexota bacterium]
MQDAAVQIDDVTHTFLAPGATQPLTVLTNVSLTVEARTFVSIVGPSGCGKTTLLRIIDGLIEPSGGEVRIDGQVVRGTARGRAMVFQDADLLPWRTALDNVVFGQEVQGVPKKERLERAQAIIARVGLRGFEHHYPFQLSGGMRQRVGLARALSTGPRLLLMDEPFGALDAQTREDMQGELLRLWEQDKVTVVFITHGVDEAILLSDYVVVLSQRPGTVREVLKIDLARPRADEEDLRGDPRFAEYRRQINQLLRSARETMRPTEIGINGSARIDGRAL